MIGGGRVGNSRNGATPMRLGTEVGDLDLATPRDRNGTFEPRLVEKGQCRVGGLSDMIISLYSGGMTVRDIQSHPERTLGTELSHETIANITDAVADSGPGCSRAPQPGVADVLIACCDGLTGFPEAIEASWPNTVVQTCVVHLIRASIPAGRRPGTCTIPIGTAHLLAAATPTTSVLLGY